MKLLFAKASPFVRKVMVVLEEAGRASDVTLVDGAGSPVEPGTAVVAANPIGKIPCLVLDDGTTLYDSRVITRYLDSHFSLGLYPQGDALWRTLNLEAHVDGILDAAILCVYEQRCRPPEERSATWVDAQKQKIQRGLDALETDWLDHLRGPVDMGQIAVGCALDYLDFRQEAAGWPAWRDARPGLLAWAGEFLDRPAMVATRPG